MISLNDIGIVIIIVIVVFTLVSFLNNKNN